MGRLYPINVIFDTGSDYLVVEGSDCTNCEGDTYDISSSGMAQQVSSRKSMRIYGEDKLEGYNWKDVACVSLSSCVFDFEFFLVTKQEGINEPADGLLGLARNKPFYINKDSKYTVGPLYLLAMRQQGVISESSFSFFMRPLGQISFVNFGKPKLDNVKNQREIFYFDVLDDFYWSTISTGISFGNPNKLSNIYSFENRPELNALAGKFDIKNILKDMVDISLYSLADGAASIYTMFDTGTSDILIPDIYYLNVIKEIFNRVDGKDYFYRDGTLYTKCYNNFPNIYFIVSGHWVELRADDYVNDVTEAQDRSLCVLRIKSIELPYIILGNPIFVDYYTIHDTERNRMGIAPHSLSSKVKIERATTPEQVIKGKVTVIAGVEVTAWPWFIVGVLFALWVVIFIIYILPLIQEAFPGSQAAEWLLSILAVGGFLILCVFLIQPAIDSAFREEEFKVWWIEDLKEKRLSTALRGSPYMRSPMVKYA